MLPVANPRNWQSLLFGCLYSVSTSFVPLVRRRLQLQDVELPALLIVQHLGDGWRHVIQSHWDGQLALAHICQMERSARTHAHTRTHVCFQGDLTIKGGKPRGSSVLDLTVK